MAYGDFKDLTKRTASHKMLPDKAFNIAKRPKYDGYRHGLASVVDNVLIRKTSGGIVKNERVSDKELAEKLQKPMNRKFNKRKVRSPFIGNICGGNLADMKFISKFYKRFRFLLLPLLIFIANMHGFCL